VLYDLSGQEDSSEPNHPKNERKRLCYNATTKLIFLTQREQTKAANYIQQLDAARCEGDWDAVPELLRKIRKHAAARSCTYKESFYGAQIRI
jgi:hypothetical protein